MRAASEQEDFSHRLRQALDQAGWRALGASGLAREFNARSAHRITLHAARKWLIGEAIPTQERIQALATWLGVSSEWLRFGVTAAGRELDATDPAAQRELSEDLGRLNARQLRLVRELVTLLLHGDPQARAKNS